MPNPTTARLRYEVDHGRGGDKVKRGRRGNSAAWHQMKRSVTITRAHRTEIEVPPLSSERRDADKAVRTYVGIFIAIALLLLCAIWFVRP